MSSDELENSYKLINLDNVDMIDDIKSDIEELKKKDLKNQEEINKLNENLQLTEEKFKSINAEVERIRNLDMEIRLENEEEVINFEIGKLKLEHEKEIQLIKTEKKELYKEIQKELKNLWYEIEEIKLELIKLCEIGKIQLIKKKLIDKIVILQRNIYNKIDKSDLTNKMEKKLMHDKIQLSVNELYKQKIDKSINAENKINGIFEMSIDNVTEFRNKYQVISSEYFFSKMHLYKLKFLIRPLLDEFYIYFCICEDPRNEYLSFPFKADVTMRIINKNQRKESKRITKFCQIEKPKNNSFETSEIFVYSYEELTNKGILTSNCFIVQCVVELK